MAWFCGTQNIYSVIIIGGGRSFIILMSILTNYFGRNNCINSNKTQFLFDFRGLMVKISREDIQIIIELGEMTAGIHFGAGASLSD